MKTQDTLTAMEVCRAVQMHCHVSQPTSYMYVHSGTDSATTVNAEILAINLIWQFDDRARNRQIKNCQYF